jgi:hypothetical protein
LLLLRFNIAVFDSKVKGIPGSNARLDQQPRGSLDDGGSRVGAGVELGPRRHGSTISNLRYQRFGSMIALRANH